MIHQPSFFFYAIILIVVLFNQVEFLEAKKSLLLSRYFLPIDNIFDYKNEHILASFPPNASYEVIKQGRLLQPLDHFDPLENRGFWQNYLFLPPWPTSKQKCDHCRISPICVFIGGDAAIHPWWLEHTFLAENCAEDGGYLFLLEHRYYGESIPKFDMNVENLRYLTIPQALEDIATFIVHVRKQHKLEKNKLFVFGASYGGTLASLFRRKYPHLTDAAVAMSAPMIRDYQNKDYLPSIERKIKKMNRMCYMLIEHGFRQATRFVESPVCKKNNFPMCKGIQKNLGLCSSLQGMKQHEKRLFLGSLMKDFALLVEYNKVLHVTLKNVCSVITHPDIKDWSPLDKILAGDIVISQEIFRSKARAGAADSDECLQVKKENICEYLQNKSLDHEVNTSGKRQRLWQACTELFGFYTSNEYGKHHPFGGTVVFPADFYQEFCKCAFDDRFSNLFSSNRLRIFHKMFGPFLPTHSNPNASLFNSGTRVIYTIGEDDPVLQRELRAVDKPGMTSRFSENAVFKIKGSSHCGEVFTKSLPSTQRRLKSRVVSKVQQDVVDQLKKWLQL